jgi:hypothetical protein
MSDSVMVRVKPALSGRTIVGEEVRLTQQPRQSGEQRLDFTRLQHAGLNQQLRGTQRNKRRVLFYLALDRL